jgi:hypothetical protein
MALSLDETKTTASHSNWQQCASSSIIKDAGNACGSVQGVNASPSITVLSTDSELGALTGEDTDINALCLPKPMSQ